MSREGDELEAALRGLMARWQTRAREADAQGKAQQRRSDGQTQGHYYRGIAEGLTLALADLRAALGEGDNPASEATAEAVERYALVSEVDAMATLTRAGLSVTELRAHNDNTFSVIFAPIVTMPFEERIEQLSRVADIEVLSYGRLPNSSRTYIDFAFRTAPESS